MTKTVKRRIGISLGALLVVASFLAYENSVFAATYTFTQSSWSGGVDGTTVAVHPTNVTNWSKYDSATGVTAGATVSLPSTNYTFTDASATSTSPVASTTGGGFGNGTNSQTAISAGSVALSKTGAATPTIAEGASSGYALKSDGTVWAWGYNTNGQLGNNSTTQSSIPVQVSNITGIINVAAGYNSGYAVKSDGTVWAWGFGSDGELGNNATAQSNVPVQVSNITGATAVTGGQNSGYALKSDGTVWAWGYNGNGQLGNNSTTQSNVPVQVSGLTGVIAIASGATSAYALKSDGTVWAWGAGSLGQLGNNLAIESHVPVQVSNITGVTAVAGGSSSGYALKSDGTVVSGGDQVFTTIFASEALANLTSLEKATDLQGKLEQLIQSSLPSLAPPFITKPEVSNITESSATITWNTNIKSYGSLRYATDADYLANKNDYKVEVSDGETESSSHAVDLASLEPNTLYHIQARSYVFPQVVGMSPDITFSTKAAAIVPNIVAVKNDGFTVVWQTNDPTSSTVSYRNTKTGERNVVTDEAKKTYHNVQIQNLPSGTTYTVSVSGTNDNGNTVTSDGTLSVTLSVDLTPPVISNFKVDNALIPGRTDLIQTVVGWQTDKPANSTVYYQEGAISGTNASSTELKNKVESLDSYTTAHIMIIPSLKPGVVYSLKVISEDQSGNSKVFGPTSIITPKATQSVLDIIVKNFEDTFKFLGAGK